MGCAFSASFLEIMLSGFAARIVIKLCTVPKINVQYKIGMFNNNKKMSQESLQFR